MPQFGSAACEVRGDPVQPDHLNPAQAMVASPTEHPADDSCCVVMVGVEAFVDVCRAESTRPVLRLE